jgi:hypothetical protein
MNRRNFFKRTAGVVVGGVIASQVKVPSLPTLQPAPAENLRELATLLSQPEPSSPEKVVERVFMEMWIRLPLDLKARVMQHGFSLDPILLALRGSGEIGRDG